MTAAEHFEQYQDAYGLISDSVTKRSTGNGLMYTAEAIVILHWHAWLTEGIRKKYLAAYEACESGPGRFKRLPNGAFGHNAPDDYYGVGLASKYLDGGEMAKRVLKAGRETGGVLNDREPGVFRAKSLMWRMPQLVAHLQLCAGETPGPYRQLVWGVSLFLNAFAKKKDQDGRAKGWQMLEAAVNAPFHMKFWGAICLIIKEMRHPGGISAIRQDYGWKPGHPTVTWGEYV